MAQNWSRTGQLWALDQLTPLLTADLEIGLFTNNFDPSATDDYLGGDIVEATFGGYARQDLNAYVAAYLNGANEAESYCPTITWMATGGGLPVDVYGIFIAIKMTLTLIVAERHPAAPITLAVVGDPFAYTPKHVLRNF